MTMTSTTTLTSTTTVASTTLESNPWNATFDYETNTMRQYVNATPTIFNEILGQSINETRHSDVINNIIIQSAFYALYATIFILGIFGNVLVCYVVFRNRAMQTVTNLFITNLALSDILLCVLAVPFTPLYTFLRRWVFGTALCHLVPYAQGCSVYISTLTLTSIAIDRFFVIIFPFHPRMKLSTCISIIVFIWIVSLLITLPYGLYVKLYASNFTGTATLYCEEDWPNEHYRKIFGSLTSILQYLLPFFIISICYIWVSVRLNDRAKAKPGSKTSRKEEVDRSRKKRTNIMLISMVAVFGFSWLPLNVVNIINDFYSRIDETKYYTLLFFISHAIAMSSTCYNPFLYAWLNDNFRKEFKQVLPFYNSFRSRNFSGGRDRFRSERTCNGNNETIQETLLPSSVMRPSLHDILIRENNQDNIQIENIHTGSHSGGHSGSHRDDNTKYDSNPDSILLSEVKPPLKLSPETIVLPSGVLETPFENKEITVNNVLESRIMQMITPPPSYDEYKHNNNQFNLNNSNGGDVNTDINYDDTTISC